MNNNAQIVIYLPDGKTHKFSTNDVEGYQRVASIEALNSLGGTNIVITTEAPNGDTIQTTINGLPHALTIQYTPPKFN